MTQMLAEKTCTPCQGGIPPLGHEEAEKLHAQAHEWKLLDDDHRIEQCGPGSHERRRLVACVVGMGRAGGRARRSRQRDPGRDAAEEAAAVAVKTAVGAGLDSA